MNDESTARLATETDTPSSSNVGASKTPPMPVAPMHTPEKSATMM